ncbi:hypothetical protein R0131_03635 [Clostridium sp. AL.422]|uniref:hypothetical protein n=1 Tax=Clostridium TaxID=1485 RepID=UPI00293DD16F|nr:MULTISPECIES: hypothetical protein [unclassified Clostridium]MDV4149919.1 hypothetical protein [Clostridium sp. AL.422]
MLAYQIGIFLIIIISSFFGFRALLTAVAFIILFSLSNIFTAALLVIQLTTIAVSTCIGAVISSIILIKEIPNYLVQGRLYIENSSFDFMPSFILVNCIRGFIAIGLFSLQIIFDNLYISSDFINTILILFILGVIFFIFIIGKKIKYKPNSFIQKASFTSFIIACGSVYLGYRVVINLAPYIIRL